MRIPMVDLKGQYQTLQSEIETAVNETLAQSQYILGPNVRAFEQETADYLGVKHAIGVASGTDALHLSLLATGVGIGDEVITTPFTFIATAEAIRYTGATPVFVDIDKATFNIDLSQVKGAITDKTKAILPVHLFGQPVDMNALINLCENTSIKLIEDCAQSFGAHIGNKKTGGFGDAGAFSFFPSKNLGCYGDGGLITTNSDEYAEHLISLRNHGSAERYHHDRIGFNSRLDELQATILRIKLKHIDEYNSNRRRVARRYSSLLKDTDIQVAHEDGIGTHVYHQYTLLHEKRDSIIKALQDRSIASAIYYPIPLHRQDVFLKQYESVSCPVAESVAARCFSLPIFPEMTDQQIDEVVSTIKGAL